MKNCNPYTIGRITSGILVILLGFFMLSTLQGCPKPPLVCPPPETVNCEYKTWPIQRAPAVPGVYIRKLDHPGVIGGVTQEDIDSLGATTYQLFLWGLKNESTLEEVNKLKK